MIFSSRKIDFIQIVHCLYRIQLQNLRKNIDPFSVRYTNAHEEQETEKSKIKKKLQYFFVIEWIEIKCVVGWNGTGIRV